MPKKSLEMVVQLVRDLAPDLLDEAYQGFHPGHPDFMH